MSARILSLLAMLVVAWCALAPTPAAAQPAPAPAPAAAAPGQPPRNLAEAQQKLRALRDTAAAKGGAVAVDPKVRAPEKYVHDDRVESNSKLMALLFWAFAAASVGGALFVVTRRNLIAAVMGMVGSFLGISAIYMMLYAHFLSVVQMLVYAGAIMVLFVFVIMILNRPEDEPVAPTGRAGQVIGGLAIVYLVGRLVMMLINVRAPNPDVANLAPRATQQGHEWGSVKAVGTDLFGPGLFPFEAISILLLVGVVGAIAIARPLHEDDEPGADNEGAKATGKH